VGAVEEVQSIEEAWAPIRANRIGAVFIDPIGLGVEEATRFILNVRQAFPTVVFVLYCDAASAWQAGLFKGDGARLAHYFSIDKPALAHLTRSDVDAIVRDCLRYRASAGGAPPEPRDAPPTVDVLLLTALKDELEAVLALEDGAVGVWHRQTDPAGFAYHTRVFRRRDGSSFNVAAARASAMGAVQATAAAVRLVQHLAPFCLAMSGVCAGRRGAVSQGDVIVADRVYQYDYGKRAVRHDKGDQRREAISLDITTYNLDPTWKQLIEDYSPDWSSALAAERPPSQEEQLRWLRRATLAFTSKKGPDPREHPERKARCPDWTRMVAELRRRREIYKHRLELTQAGIRVVNQDLLDHPDGHEARRFRVHVGPIASGNMVVEDREIFEGLRRFERQTLGLEMEAAAVGFVAAQEGVPKSIIAKGVQDFADHEKDDSLRFFAASASAAFLLSFFQSHLPVDPRSGRAARGTS
jgi:nucleoside phosphorylase